MIGKLVGSAGFLSSGGTIGGDLTISGDLTVEGSGGAVYDEIIEGSLHIKTGSAGTISDLAYADDLVIEQTGEGVGLSLRFDDDRSGSIVWQSTTSDNIARIYASYSSGNEVLAFETVGIERIIIDDDGHSTFKGNIIIDETAGTSNSAVLMLKADRGSDGQDAAEIQFYNNHANYYAAIFGERGSADNYGDLVIKTRNSSGIGERVRIDEDGNVGIGGTPTAAKLEIHGGTHLTSLLIKGSGAQSGIKFVNSSSSPDGYIYASGGSIGFLDDDADWTVKCVTDTSVELIVADLTKLKVDANSRISLSNNAGGAGNTVFGSLAGDDLESGGTYNTFFGANAGHENQLGDSNIAIGSGTMDASYIDDTQDALTIKNVFIGNNAGGGTWTGAACHLNVGIGHDALAGAMNGIHSAVAIGYNALTAATHVNASGTVAVGREAGVSIIDSTGTTAIGAYALQQLANTHYNTAVGTQAGQYTTGADNTYVGFKAGFGAAGAEASNVGIGKDALLSITTGTDNVAVGIKALEALTDSQYNVGIGRQAAFKITTGDKNISIGGGTLATATTASNIIAIGHDAAYSVSASSTVGDGTVAIGTSALNVLTNGARNTAIGYQAGLDILGAGDSTIIGYQAGKEVQSGDQTTAVGTYAVGGNSAAVLTGNANTGIGYKALYVAQGAAANNTAVGANALSAITTGSHNIAIGAFAGDAMTDNTLNVIIGKSAFSVADAGENYNIVIGGDAGTAINDGDSDYNVLIGQDAGTGGAAAMISCVAIGGNAMNSTDANAQTGTIAIGHDALTALTAGTGNLAIGYLASASMTVGSSNIAIGSNALTNEVGGGGSVAIGTDVMVNQDGGDSAVNMANVGVGANAGHYNVTGSNNTNIGNGACLGTSGQSGSNITAIGSAALNVAYGQDNTAVGQQAGLLVTSGVRNCLIGTGAGDAITDGNYVTAVGVFAGSAINHTNASGTTLVGYSAGLALTSGARNLAVGYQALYQSDVCSDSIAIGYLALSGTDAGTNNKNIAIGNYALDANMTHNTNNIAIGYNSLTNLAGSGGIYNTFVGDDSGVSLTNADYNTGVGSGVFGEASGNAMTGVGNTGVGALAGYNLEGVAHSNTLIGYGAGNASNAITTGISNVCIGDGASTSSATADNQISIGTGAVGQADNSVTLGNDSVTDVYMSQDSGAYVHSQNVTNHVSNTMSAPYYRFDGSNDDITVADSAHLSFGDGNSGDGTDIPFSISAWINMEDATNFPIASKGVYNSTGEWLFGTDGSDLLKFQLHDESVDDTFEKASTTALTAYQGKWMHVAATYSGVGGTSANAGIKLYVNGVSQSLTLAGGGTYVAMENLTAAVHIGRYDSDYAQGSIAGVKIHNHELSATEVKEDYSGASVPFKYVYANNTLLNTGTAANTGSFDTFGSASLAGYSASNSSASGTKAVAILMTGANLKKGDYIGLTINHTTFANVTVTGWKIGESAGGGNSYTNTQVGVGSGISHTTNLVTMDSIANPYLRITYSTASNTDIVAADIKLIRVGAVAEYDGSGIGASRWDDKSGNELHGTVSGATVENAPADADSGLTYEEGTWTPVLLSGTTAITRSGGTDTATYTKIGNMVTVQWSFESVTTAGSFENSNTTVTGLPFTSGTAKLAHGSVFSIFGNTSFSAIPHFTRVVTGTTVVDIMTQTATTYTTLEVDAVGSGTWGGFSLTYWV